MEQLDYCCVKAISEFGNVSYVTWPKNFFLGLSLQAVIFRFFQQARKYSRLPTIADVESDIQKVLPKALSIL